MGIKVLNQSKGLQHALAGLQKLNLAAPANSGAPVDNAPLIRKVGAFLDKIVRAQLTTVREKDDSDIKQISDVGEYFFAWRQPLHTCDIDPQPTFLYLHKAIARVTTKGHLGA